MRELLPGDRESVLMGKRPADLLSVLVAFMDGRGNDSRHGLIAL